MKIISKIINVSQFSITENGLLYLLNTGEVFLNYKLIKSNVETLAYIDSEKNFFFGEKGKLNTYCEDLNSSELLDLEYISPFFNTLGESIYICYEFKIDDFSTKIIKYNILLKQKEKTIISDTKLKVLFGNKIYLVLFDSEKENSHSITLYNHQTETTLWQYSVADLGAEKVSKILGVFGETLVVVGQIKENTFVLFGLSVQTGQLLWKHDTVFERNSDGRTLRVKLNLPYADTTSNKIIIFEAGFYIEIEGSSGQILKWIDVFKSPFQYNDLTIDAYAFDISQADEDHIYFRTSVPTYGMYTGAGIFNRKTDKLEFLEIIKNEKGNPVIIGPLKIQATKEKYYVLDTQNTLHIFEREDETPDLNQ